MSAAPAGAKPVRSGFTGDLGAGLALTFAQSANVANCVNYVCGSGSFVSESREFGFAGVSASLGGFVSPRVAILGRDTKTSFVRGGDVISYEFLGPVVEIWATDWLFVGGGAGLAVAARNGILLGTGKDATAGWGLDLRAGLAVLQGAHNDLTLSLELTPTFYRDHDVRTHVTGGAFVAAWKWY